MAAGVTDTPEVVLADAGYWHGEQIDALMGQGVQVLIPPDADKRRGTSSTRAFSIIGPICPKSAELTDTSAATTICCSLQTAWAL